ncbi:hypothetical protein U1Q18_001794 [Sarracenia purpurea var. burkii]
MTDFADVRRSSKSPHLLPVAEDDRTTSYTTGYTASYTALVKGNQSKVAAVIAEVLEGYLSSNMTGPNGPGDFLTLQGSLLSCTLYSIAWVLVHGIPHRLDVTVHNPSCVWINNG